ncbi:MAG: DUF4143 domain-containing protein [Promicromonosporaceae bacterium]|nr:DUF4143 domain-containing protein [Promicromonosporaceae bacterium]
MTLPAESPQYRPRVADTELAIRLRSLGAVLIDGPKACGKTATAMQVAASVYRMDEDLAAQTLLANAPESLFDVPTPILFDEWQETPALWNRVRRQVDDRRAKGLYVLTGSATPSDDVRRHSGAGRIGVLGMRPMSLYESGHSSGEVSLAALFNGERQQAREGALDFLEAVRRIVVGGWPELIAVDEEAARFWLDGYLTNAIEVDVQRLGSSRNPAALRRLLTALGRGVGQAVKRKDLRADVGGADGSIAEETLTAYLAALERLHLIENSPAWRPHMRSRTPLRQASVYYFTDPSLGVAALKVGSRDLIADPQALGFHFEALVLRDLRVYAGPLRAQVASWRDASGHEVDAVISVRDDLWGAVEVKLSPEAVDDAAASLLRFSKKVDQARHGAPAFLAVIVSHGRHAFQRLDGVYQIPIGCLGP